MGTPAATGCAVGAGDVFNGASDVALSPDGLSAYGISANAGTIARFRRQLVPTCGSVSRDVGPPANIPLSCTDRNGETLTYKADSQPLHGALGAIDHAAAAVRYTPAVDYTGKDSFTYSASDQLDSSGPATVSLNVSDKTAPSLDGLEIAPTTVIARAGAGNAIDSRRRRKRRASTIRFRLTEAATTTIAVQRAQTGRRVRGKCRKRTRGNRRRAKCTRYVTLGNIKVNGKKGTNSRRFNGKLRGKRLRPGRYQLAASAVDIGGNSSKRATKRFRVVRGR
jgi:hypothetical protein